MENVDTNTKTMTERKHACLQKTQRKLDAGVAKTTMTKGTRALKPWRQ